MNIGEQVKRKKDGQMYEYTGGDEMSPASYRLVSAAPKQEAVATTPALAVAENKSLIGNPLSAFDYRSPQSQGIKEQFKKGGIETAELWEQGKPGQSYLHSLGTLGGAIGSAVMAPLSAGSPRLAQMAGKGLAYAMTPRQPGEESRTGMTVYGMPTGDVRTMPPTRPGTTVSEITAANPTATRIAGDIASTLGIIPAVKGPAIALEQVGKQIIKPTGKALMASALKTDVPKIIAPDIDAIHASLPSKFKKDLGTSDFIEQKKILSGMVIKHGLDKFIRNKDQFQSKTLDLASKAAERAENEALKAFYPVKELAPGIRSISPAVKLNPWSIAEDAIFAEKQKKSLGLFTGIKKQQLERAYRTLQKDWSPEWNKSKNLEELIQFKREVLNKDKEIFKKEADIDPAERGEIQVKKLIYHSLNDKLADVSPEYKQWNKEAKDLFNLAEAAGKYSPVEKKSVFPIVGGALGTSAGGAIGYTLGKWPGSAIGAAAGGTLGTSLGVALKGKPRAPMSLKELVGRGLSETPNRYQKYLKEVEPTYELPSQTKDWSNYIAQKKRRP